MGKWKWEGVDKNGKVTVGSSEARNERDIRRSLRSKGIKVRKLSPPSWVEFDLTEWMVEREWVPPFSQKQLGSFTRQLSTLVNAGVPILQSLEILHGQESSATLKYSIKKIQDNVISGKSLADAMTGQPGFDRLYCNLIKSGESGGVLDKILIKITEHIERRERTKAQIKSAMMYPSIIVVVSVIVIYIMLVYVVPKFEEMLKDNGQELPELTAFVINASKFLQEYGLHCVAIITVLIFMFRAYVKTKSGKKVYDNLTMKLPLFGPLLIKANASGLTRTLSTMLNSGVSLIDSLEIVSETVDNAIMAEDIMKVRRAVTQGKTLSEPMRKIPYFPEMVTQMIKVGEQTGQLDSMMEKVSAIYEEEVNNLITGMTKLIEPIILVTLGGIVAVILLAMYLPIFQAAGAQ